MNLILHDLDIEMKRPRDIRKPLVEGPEQRSKSITHDAFVDLKRALEDALAFERGERRDLDVTRITDPTLTPLLTSSQEAIC